MKPSYIKQAKKLGAKFYRFDTGKWACLDMYNTDLFYLTFYNLENAARAFLIVHSKQNKRSFL